MEGPTPDEVRVVGMSTVAAAHTVYVETVRANFGESGLEAIGEANRLHGIELGKEGVKSGALRKGDLKSIYEFFAAAHPYFGFELDLLEVTDRLIDIKVTACPWIDTFKARGAKEDICHWVCKMDEGIAQAMDPELTMSIPKCMMRGDDHCIY
ncbi:MAG: L-2-amino-thiazoline-4-carboxylic acid hydrolase, partial [Candidatus Thorarchaeota archaeon]